MIEPTELTRPGSGDYRWIVDFGTASPRKTEMINLVGSNMFRAIAQIFLKVIVPDAHILEQDDSTIQRIGFLTRASGRKFVSTFSGKLSAV